MKHVLMRSLAMAILAFSTSCLAEEEAAEQKSGPPEDFQGFKAWMDSAPLEEKAAHFHKLSPNYIEKHGEDTNNLRLCINLDQNWMGLDNWVDQRWREVGVRHLDNQKYNDWIVNSNYGQKPWIVMFAYTPFTGPSVVQPTDNMMRNLACVAKIYEHKFNVGFMDHRSSEKVFESYDVKLDYGRTTPALIIFDSGKAYPAKANTLSAIKLSEFVENYKQGECQYCGQEVQAPQTELTMYIEYAKNEIALSVMWMDTYNFLHEAFNNTQIDDVILKPYFGPTNGKKAVGGMILSGVMIPVFWNLIVLILVSIYGIGVCYVWCNMKPKEEEVDDLPNAQKEKVTEKKAAKQTAQAKIEKPASETASSSSKNSGKKNKKKRGEKLE